MARYARIKGGVVANMIVLRRSQESEFPECVEVQDDLPVGIGDTYADGKFYHDGVEVKTPTQLLAEAEEALSIILGGEIT